MAGRGGRKAGSKNSPTQWVCVDCGASFLRVSGTRIRCDECRVEYRRRYARERIRREMRCLECGVLIESQDGILRRATRCPTHAAEHEVARVARKESIRRYRRHGLTEERYVEMLKSQDERCAICGSREPDSFGRAWHIDHDHSCCPGTYGCERCVRGLLCQSCNQGLGYFNDDPDLVVAAIEYLVRTSIERNQ